MAIPSSEAPSPEDTIRGPTITEYSPAFQQPLICGEGSTTLHHGHGVDVSIHFRSRVPAISAAHHGGSGERAVMSRLRGRCHCGVVQLEVEDAFVSAFYCHCSRCRRQTGSAFAALGSIEVEKFAITSGEDALSRSAGSPDGHSAACGLCHARIYAIVRERRYVHIPLGILADAPSIRPGFHIYVGSKAPWYTITDGLPQHHELPG